MGQCLKIGSSQGGGEGFVWDYFTFRTSAIDTRYNYTFDMTQIPDHDKIVMILVGNAYSNAIVAIDGATSAGVGGYGAQVITYYPGSSTAILSFNIPRCPTGQVVRFNMIVIKTKGIGQTGGLAPGDPISTVTARNYTTDSRTSTSIKCIKKQKLLINVGIEGISCTSSLNYITVNGVDIDSTGSYKNMTSLGGMHAVVDVNVGDTVVIQGQTNYNEKRNMFICIFVDEVSGETESLLNEGAQVNSTGFSKRYTYTSTKDQEVLVHAGISGPDSNPIVNSILLNGIDIDSTGAYKTGCTGASNPGAASMRAVLHIKTGDIITINTQSSSYQEKINMGSRVFIDTI